MPVLEFREKWQNNPGHSICVSRAGKYDKVIYIKIRVVKREFREGGCRASVTSNSMVFKEHSCQEITMAGVDRQSCVMWLFLRKSAGKRSGGGPVKGPLWSFLLTGQKKMIPFCWQNKVWMESTWGG